MSMCRKGLHSLDDPATVAWRTYPNGTKTRSCRLCRNAWARRRWHAQNGAEDLPRQLEWRGPRRLTTGARWQRRARKGLASRRGGGCIAYRLSPTDVRMITLLAEGYTVREIAARDFCTLATVAMRLLQIRKRLGVTNSVQMVAQCLKRGVIRPDKATARRLRRQWEKERQAQVVIVFRKELKEVIAGQRQPHVANSDALMKRLRAIQAHNAPHAVSVMWALGHLTSRHVPQTRNSYRGKRAQ